MPALEPHISGRSILPGAKYMSKLSMRGIAGEAIEAGNICYVSAVGAAYPTVMLASTATPAEARGQLFVARGPAPAAGSLLELLPITVIDEVNTNGATIGDPVYLGADGVISLTASGIRRKIGTVAKVGTTDGEVLFNGAPVAGGQVIAGLAAVSAAASVTINAAALGGSFGGKAVVATTNTSSGGVYVLRATWSTDDLTITLSGSFTGNVAYFIFLE